VAENQVGIVMLATAGGGGIRKPCFGSCPRQQ
jgi:hypothetical protein